MRWVGFYLYQWWFSILDYFKRCLFQCEILPSVESDIIEAPSTCSSEDDSESESIGSPLSDSPFGLKFGLNTICCRSYWNLPQVSASFFIFEIDIIWETDMPDCLRFMLLAEYHIIVVNSFVFGFVFFSFTHRHQFFGYRNVSVLRFKLSTIKSIKNL